MSLFFLTRFGRWLAAALAISILVATSAPSVLSAASITWTTRALITGDSDVSTNGGLLYAYDDSNISATVNGVAFNAGNSPSSLGGNVTISGYYWYNATAFGSGSGVPWTSFSAAYQSVLQGGVYASSNVTMTITLNNLTAGHPYQLQIWVNDTRIGASNRTETVTSSGGNTVTLDYNNTSANGGVGQYAIGTFTADATTQVFTLTGAQPAAGNSAQLNAIQVRDQSAQPGTLLANIALNPATTYQQIYGIGGNFCQGDQITLNNYNRYSEVFSDSGLNLSFIRLGQANELTNSMFAGFDAANVAVTKQFRALQPDGRITLTAWSPPEVLKSTGSAFQGTLATNAAGKYVYTNFANWWLRTLQYYQSNSALPDYVSLQNECDFTPSGTTPAYEAGCYLNSTEISTKAGYPQALSAVRSVFQANGLGATKIIGPDTTGISQVNGYLTALTGGTVDGISHHLYGENAATTGASKLSTLNTQYPSQLKFMTELNPGDNLGTNQPDWMGLAVTMHNVFTLENAGTYLIWSVMWNTINPYNGQPAGTKSYYPLGHFSKFIRPGDRRANVTCSDNNLLVSLYRRTNSNPAIADVLVMVLINDDTNYVSANLNTYNYWAPDPLQRSWQVYKTANDGTVQQRLSLTENLAGPSLAGNRTLVLASNSITTVIINTGVYTNAPPVFTSSAANQAIYPGQTLLVTNTASDPNQPAQTLTFSLSAAPAGATLNSTNGILNWRPLLAQADSTNAFRLVVADNGSPSLTATQNFSVTVLPLMLPALSSSSLGNGLFGLVVGGVAGPDYTLQASTNLLTWTNVFTTNPATLPFTWTDTNAAGFNRRFYRTLLGP